MSNTLKIGAHLSISKGYAYMAKEALSIGANTFQFFTRNPRGINNISKEVNYDDIAMLNELLKENNFAPILAHAPYTLNPASDKEHIRKAALELFRSDLDLLENIKPCYYNFHPGCHMAQGVDRGLELVIEVLDSVLKEDYTTLVLLETMSGKGSELGSSFEEIARVIEKVKLSDKLGVCLDTCHVFSAGYNIREELDSVLERFDKVIGLERLKAIHLNDTKVEFSSRKDRHELIGKGFLGLDAIVELINHPKLRDLPFYLETPNDVAGYKEEIALLRERYR